MRSSSCHGFIDFSKTRQQNLKKSSTFFEFQIMAIKTTYTSFNRFSALLGLFMQYHVGERSECLHTQIDTDTKSLADHSVFLV